MPRRETDPGAPAGPPTATFDRVLVDELGLIRARRNEVEGAEPDRPPSPPAADADKRLMDARCLALDEHVTGLAFSGGGIRAATLAVGFLQGLAHLGLVKRFDYLSTVSGGGYAGGWVAAWLKRDGSPANVERQLDPNRVAEAKADRAFVRGQVVDEEPEPLRHLRAFSSYLFPRPGLTSVGTWTVILIWARNVLINLLMLLPAGMLLVVAARLVVFAYGALNAPDSGGGPRGWWVAFPLAAVAAGAAALWVAFDKNAASLREFRDGRGRETGGGDVESLINRRIVYPALAAVVLLTIPLRWALGLLARWLDRPFPDFLDTFRAGLWRVGALRDRPLPHASAANPATLWRLPWDFLRSHLALLDAPNFLFHAVFFGTFMAAGAFRAARRDRHGRAWRFAGAAFVSGASGGVLLVLLEAMIEAFARASRPDLMAALVPPLSLGVLVVGLIVEVAVLGRTVGENEREWWARLSAMLTLSGLAWLGVAATVLYVPGAFLAAGAAARAAIASGWLASAAFGVFTGRYVLPRVAGRGLGLTAVLSVASQVFLVGLLGAIALLASVLTDVPSLSAPRGDSPGPFAYYLEGVRGAPLPGLLLLAAGSYALFRLARARIDVNLFSLHAMYTNRLTRCYLGASRPVKSWARRWAEPRDPRADAGAPSLAARPDPQPPVRDPNPVTGFDPADDIDLVDLRFGATGGATGDRRYLGPHLLINTTLNLVGGGELAVRDRKGESFTLTPLYCGSKGLGYAPTDATRGNLSLGTAVAISGAAVDPNMRFYQSAPLTALLTIFNARLGYWVEAPKPSRWKASSPRFGDLLFTEAFGRTDGKGEYVHLSDGAHFENLGVYELVRRRCRYIVALDAASDGDPSDDDLATLIRLCRIDFGVRIKIDTAPLAPAGPDGLTGAHVVVGTIHYDDTDQGELPGVLVYVKSSLTGDEPPDVQKYARKDPRFPLQPTDLRQSFDEEQFECYRCLGDHVAREVFADAVARVNALFPAGRLPAHKEYIPRLFSATQLRWSEPPKGSSGYDPAADHARAGLRADLARRPELAALGRELYPEFTADPPGTGRDDDGRRLAEVQAVERMLDVMEADWLSLGLGEGSGLPVNRGRMNAFRRWTSTEAFRRTWPALRAGRGDGFVRFCEDQLHASTAPPAAVRLPDGFAAEGFEGRALAELAAEFAREWPDDARSGRGLPDLVRRAADLRLPRLPVWLLWQAPSGPDGAESSPERFAAGVILAAAFPDHPAAETLPSDRRPVELFVWVRPPLRSAGLASLTARDVVRDVRDDLSASAPGAAPPSLWARYPGSGDDDDREHNLWLSFFARYDFRRRYPERRADARPVTLLECVPS